MIHFNGLFLAAGKNAAQSQDATASTIYMLVIIVAMFALLYLFMIRPQRKKEKKLEKMRNAMQVGDNIVTVGGIVGRVVSIKDDTVTIETGADRSKMRIKKWAIQTVETIHDN